MRAYGERVLHAVIRTGASIMLPASCRAVAAGPLVVWNAGLVCASAFFLKLGGVPSRFFDIATLFSHADKIFTEEGLQRGRNLCVSVLAKRRP